MKTFSLKNIGAVVNRAVTNKYLSLLICLASGILAAIPYYAEELFVFTFLSLFIFFFVIISNRNAKRVFLPCFCYFTGFYVPLYLFLSELYPFDRFGFNEDQALFILICACVAIPLLHAFVESTVMLLYKLLPKNGFDIIGIASLWVIGEWILTLGGLAFPWGGVAVSLTGFLPYLQTASFFGKYFITFVTVLGCYAIALSLSDKKRLFAIIGASVILLNAAVGTVMWFIPSEKSDEVYSAAVQGNVLSNEKWDSANNVSIFERYISLTEEAAQNGAELIILPESAIPVSFVPDGRIHTALAEIAVEYEVTIVAGVHYYDSEKKENYNSVIAIMPDGSLSERYDKRHLVPFGEFIPFAKLIGEFLPFVEEFNEGTSDLVEGKEPIVIETEHGNVAPLVCFDSIFTQFAQEGVLNDADMIVVVTNDSWFNDSAGIYTHLRHAQIRAIENKRYVLRAANTGVSSFINERGEMLTQTEPLTVDITYSNVYSIENKTLYTYIGDLILYISFGLVIILIIYNPIKKLINRRVENGNNSITSE